MMRILISLFLSFLGKSSQFSLLLMYCNVFVLERIFLLHGDANGVKCALLLLLMMPSNSQRRAALLANEYF